MNLRVGIAILLTFTLMLIGWSFSSNDRQIEDFSLINGVAFTGPSYEMNASEIDSVKNTGVNWICWMPYSYVRQGNLKDTFPGQWWGESFSGVRKCVQWSKTKNTNSFVKPHIWFTNGSFTGEFKCSSQEDWLTFEKQYSAYILKFAALAEEENVKLFCIGVELKTFVQERPLFWKELIRSVRKIYSGKLTYAANWDNYANIPFWEELDYIGIDAYFPYSTAKTPSLKELVLKMKQQSAVLTNFSRQHKKQVIFTEYGYRSEDYCCQKPWEHKRGKPINLQCQETAFQAFFKVFPKEDWYAGGFIWKWFASGHYNEEGNIGYRFKDKPAAQQIKNSFLMTK